MTDSFFNSAALFSRTDIIKPSQVYFRRTCPQRDPYTYEKSQTSRDFKSEKNRQMSKRHFRYSTSTLQKSEKKENHRRRK